jgi:endonuclease/exonuclease/phosphatase family metal-dependent hydrolase
VATFNIRSGRGADNRCDLDRTAALLGGLDLVALHEVRGPTPRRPLDQAAILGRKLNMPSLFAPSEIRFGREYFGNGLLCRPPVASWRRIPLPGTRHKGQRNMVLARVALRGRTVSVLLTHLDPLVDREAQLEAALARFLSLEAPAVLLGDLNTPASDPRLRALLARADVCEALGGAPGPAGARRVDWIFARGLRVADAGRVPNDASDHPLLWAELRPLPADRSAAAPSARATAPDPAAALQAAGESAGPSSRSPARHSGATGRRSPPPRPSR